MSTALPSQAIELTAEQIEALSEHTQQLMAEHHVPGVAIGLLTPAGQHELCFGVTNVENPLPVTADTLFQIGSTTKTVTATVLMRLVEAGKVDLDAPVRTYLPDLKLMDEAAAAGATVRQLLNHTGGWVGDYFENTGNGDDALARIVANLATQPQVTPLGEVFSYNNAAFYIAGRVIEVVTGLPYEVAVKQNVLDPLGLKHSFFFQDDVMTRQFAVGHVVKSQQPVVARPWGIGRSAHAAGGLASSVRDQLAYARFHLGDGTAASGERILSEASMRLMQTPTREAGGDREIAVSWFVRETDGVREISHGGATNGQMSAFMFVPEKGFAFTALTNADTGNTLNNQLVSWVREHLLGLTTPEPAFLEVDDATLTELTGHYLMAGMGDALTITRGESGLLLQMIEGDYSVIAETPGDPPPPVPVQFYAPDKLIATEGLFKGAKAEVLRDPNGRVQWLRLGRVYRKES